METVVRFDPAPGPLDNPLKGWCTYTDAGTIHQPYRMVFRYVSWRELEPEEGKFRFAEWEQETWEVPAARGKHIVLRIYIDYPTLPSGLPEWLRQKGVRTTRYTQFGGGESPDYAHPHLIGGLERLLAAMGERYNRHPRIAFLQLGLLGHWGEWHTYPRDELFAPEAVQRRVVDAYRKAFPDKKLMARYAHSYPGKQDWLGFHDDFFPEDTGDEGSEKDWYFLYNMKRSGRAENWRRSVIGGEMIPERGKNALKWLGSAADFAFTLRRAEEAHFTWIGPYSPALEKPPNAEFTRRCEALVRRMGYQYRLTELRHPASVRAGSPWVFTLTGRNDGVAPFYYPWSVELALISERGTVTDRQRLPQADLRQWLPGNFTLRDTVRWNAPPGKYVLALGIIDPLTNTPAIRFANRLNAHPAGWVTISQLTVSQELL
ncbi:MAG: hypothetical protein OHK0029_01940 [Armatimonadaceae bacterium]